MAKIDTNGYDVTFGSGIGGYGGLSKSGNGSLTLNAVNTYSGPTTVNGGVLNVSSLSGTVVTLNVPAGGTANLGASAAITTLNISGGAANTTGAGVTVQTLVATSGSFNAVPSLSVANSATLSAVTVSRTLGSSFALSGANLVAPTSGSHNSLTANGGTLSFVTTGLAVAIGKGSPGAPASPATASFSGNGVWTMIDGQVQDISNNVYGTDNHAFQYMQMATGDFDIKVHVTGSLNASVGLMARDNLTSLYDSHSGDWAGIWNSYQSATTINGTMTMAGPNTGGTPWLEIKKAGNVVTTYFSTNGTDYTQSQQQDYSAHPWGATTYLGLDMTSTTALVGHVSGSYDNVNFMGTASMPDWSYTDVAVTTDTTLALPTAPVSLGIVSFTAGNLVLSGPTAVSLDSITGSSGTLSNGSGGPMTLTLRNGSGTFAGTIADGTHPVSLVYSSGLLTLSGSSTYIGSTTLNGGTLQIVDGGSIDHTSGIAVNSAATLDVSTMTSPFTVSGKTIAVNGTVNGSLTVASGALLTGTGSFTGSSGLLSISGTVSPGTFGVSPATDGVGTLSVGSIGNEMNLHLDSAAVYNWGITSVSHGLINVKGSVTVASGATVNLAGGGIGLSTDPNGIPILTWTTGTAPSVPAVAHSAFDPGSSTVHWLGGTGTNWDTGANWDLYTLTGGAVVVNGNSFELSGVVKAGESPRPLSAVVIAPATGSVTGPSGNTTVGSLVIGSSDGSSASSLALQAGVALTVTNATTVHPSAALSVPSGGTLASASLATGGDTTFATGAVVNVTSLSVANSGILRIAEGGQVGSGGVIVNGGTLQLNGNSTSDNSRALTVNGGAIDVPQTATLSGPIGGTAPLTKTGDGTLIVTGAANTFPSVAVNKGTVQGNTTSIQTNVVLNGGNANVTFDQPTAGTYTKVISGTGSLTKANVGTLTLTTSQSYSGPTIINNGTLKLQGIITSPGLLGQYYANIGTSAQNPTNVVHVETDTLTQLNSELATLVLDQSVASTVRATQRVLPSFFVSADHTMWDQTTGSQPYQTNVDNFVVRWTGNFVAPLDGDYTFSTSDVDDRAAIWLDNSDAHTAPSGGSGIVHLSQGPHPITIAFQEWGGNDHFNALVTGPAGSGLSNTNIPNSVLDYATGSVASNILPVDTPLTVNATLDLNSVSQQLGSLSGSGTVSNSGASPATLTIAGTGGAFAGTISDGASKTSLVMNGGTLTLTGSNTYSGTTVVDSGLLHANALGALSSTSDVTVTGGTLDSGSFARTIYSLTMGSLGTLNLHVGDVLTATNTSIIDGTLNLSGIANGRVLLMSFPGGYTGTFSNSPGYTLDYPNPNEIDVIGAASHWALAQSGSWSESLKWTGTVPAGNGAQAVIDPPTSGSNFTITLDSAKTLGTLEFGNAGNPNNGYTLIGTDTLTLNNSGSDATITVTNGKHAIEVPIVLENDLVVSGSGALTLSGSISEFGGVHKLTMNGAGGTLVLSGTGLYTGGTIVNAGILAVTSGSALPDNQSLTVGAGGTLIFDPSYTASPIVLGQVLSAVSPVPEPGTLALLLAGLVVGIGAWRRRRIAN